MASGKPDSQGPTSNQMLASGKVYAFLNVLYPPSYFDRLDRLRCQWVEAGKIGHGRIALQAEFAKSERKKQLLHTSAIIRDGCPDASEKVSYPEYQSAIADIEFEDGVELADGMFPGFKGCPPA